MVCARAADWDIERVYRHRRGIRKAKRLLTDHRWWHWPHNQRLPAFSPPCHFRHMEGRNITAWVVFALLLFALGLGAFSKRGGEEIIPWRTSLPDAQAEAAAAGKLVLAYFTADWCGPCQSMKGTTWADAEVEQSLRDSYVPVKIDVDTQPDIAMQHRIQSIPAFVILSSDGRRVRSTIGYLSSDEMIYWLGGGELGR